MTFLRADLLRRVPDGFAIGSHLLEVHPTLPAAACWSLRCGGCLAELADGVFDPNGPLLGGALSVPGVGASPPVSWAWGARTARRPPEIIFVRGVLRRAAVTHASPVASGCWVAAAPGPARAVIAVATGRAVRSRTEQLSVPLCPGPVPGTR